MNLDHDDLIYPKKEFEMDDKPRRVSKFIKYLEEMRRTFW